MRKYLYATIAAFFSSVVLCGPVTAVTTTYTSDSAYFAAAGAQTTQNFNSPLSQTATSVVYPNVTFSCSGSTFCPGFFGTSSTHTIDGLSVYFSTPDTATFTFSSPINSFGVYIAGLGDTGTTTLSVNNSNGFSSNLFTNYTGTTTSFETEALFAGLISDTAFTSVTFSGTFFGDGIFFDNLSFGSPSAVPLPGALPLFATGLGMLGLLGWRRKRKQVAA